MSAGEQQPMIWVSLASIEESYGSFLVEANRFSRMGRQMIHAVENERRRARSSFQYVWLHRFQVISSVEEVASGIEAIRDLAKTADDGRVLLPRREARLLELAKAYNEAFFQQVEEVWEVELAKLRDLPDWTDEGSPLPEIDPFDAFAGEQKSVFRPKSEDGVLPVYLLLAATFILAGVAIYKMATGQ